LDLSHLEPIDYPFPTCEFDDRVFDLFHSFYRAVVLTSWDRGMSDCEAGAIDK